MRTFDDLGYDRQFGNVLMLIKERLAANANIIPANDSIYRWQDEINHAAEAYAVIHTVDTCFAEIVD